MGVGGGGWGGAGVEAVKERENRVLGRLISARFVQKNAEKLGAIWQGRCPWRRLTGHPLKESAVGDTA